MKKNLSGMIIDKSFINQKDILTDEGRVILTNSGEKLHPNKYYDGLLDDQIDIGYFEDLTIIFINNIRKVDAYRLSKLCQVFKFGISDTACCCVFDYYKDGFCNWDEYISADEDGQLKSTGANVVRFQNKDITMEVFPALVKHLFNLELETILKANFTRYSFKYNYE